MSTVQSLQPACYSPKSCPRQYKYYNSQYDTSMAEDTLTFEDYTTYQWE